MSRNKQIRATETPPRRSPTAVDIVDRVLDRGMVIDYHADVTVGGINALVTMDGRYVVASTQTDLEFAAPFRAPARAADARPCFDGPADPFVWAPVASERTSRRSRPRQRQRKKP